MSEKWRPVVGFEGAYEVSALGNVRSVARVVTKAARGVAHYKGKLLKPGIASSGYPSVVLGRAGGTHNVHVLVATAFIGPCPAGYEVRHKDGTRSNPNLDNLEYGSRLDNISDAQKHGTWYTPARYGPQRLRDWHGRFC